ncbi:MAG: hypothetical protein JWP37_1440 [Mucilaginibacter sp.]|nr:hypothetical protein [Mucilaginibacter sp.]
MKHKYLILILAALATCFAGCKKSSGSENVGLPLIKGKWQETKLRLYTQDSTSTILYDTTYLQPFTNLDYAQFNNNGTCVIGTDHYYYPNQPGEPKNPQKINAITANWNYTAVGAKFVLSAQNNLVNPGGFDIRDTVSAPNPNTLLIRSVFYSRVGNFKSISDSYYTR